MDNSPKQRVCKYKTISGDGVLDFDERVNYAMDRGFVPCGSMQVIDKRHGQPEFFQTMIYAPEPETPECLK